MRPAVDPVARVERGDQFVVTEWPEEIVLQVVRTGPDQLDRPACRLRDERGLRHEIVREPAPEAASDARHLDADCGPRNTRDRMDGPLRSARLLQGGNDARAVGHHVHERTRSLERSVAHVWLAIAGLDDARSIEPRRVEISVVADDKARPLEEFRALPVERGARLAGKGPACPLDLERFAALERGPGVIGDDGDAGREVRRDRLTRLRPGHDDDRAHARHGTRRAVVEARDLAIEVRAAKHDGRPGIRLVDVDAVARAAGDDFLGIDDALRPADDPVLGWLLERHGLGGQRELCGRGGELAIGKLAAIGMPCVAVTRPHCAACDAPARGRRFAHEPSALRTELAQLFPAHPGCWCCRRRPARPSATAAVRR